ncbi:hypothetical protein FWD07_01350 [Candidatus Saccharibacteria bacterium]|nr:hypothetical protein [Candidatus Saccharibacteria bacterium]
MTELVIFLVAVLVVGVLLFGVVSVTRKKGVVLDKEKYQTRWLEIEQQLKKEEEMSYTLVILEADKLLDHAMNEMGVLGKTMGERMKAVNSRWSSANSVWHAHKLRNKIAHEHGFKVNHDQAKRALAAFRQGLKDLGAV